MVAAPNIPHAFWPLFGLRLRTADLLLRPLNEADLGSLAETFPDDVELDPALPRFGLVGERTDRGTATCQWYWRCYGDWRTDSWRLNFGVFAAERFLGVQQLEGNDFPVLRTVETFSYLLPSARGKGVGKEMRRAVLALAFGLLGAVAANTEAWHDNWASLSVSRSLGYQPNGESLHRRGDRVDLMVQMRLRRADWLAGDTDPVEITGFDPCRPFFGLA